MALRVCWIPSRQTRHFWFHQGHPWKNTSLVWCCIWWIVVFCERWISSWFGSQQQHCSSLMYPDSRLGCENALATTNDSSGESRKRQMTRHYSTNNKAKINLIELYLTLISLSVLPGTNLAILVQQLPNFSCIVRMIWSSSSVHRPLFRSVIVCCVLNLSRHCFVVRPGKCLAISAHDVDGWPLGVSSLRRSISYRVRSRGVWCEDDYPIDA